MSKLTELIGKLGRQSPQPLGFSALTSQTSSTPTMALIARSTASELASALDAVDSQVVDAVLLDRPADQAVDEDAPIWGVSTRSLSDEDVAELVSSGCDFFIVDPRSAPAGVVSQHDCAMIVELAETVEWETALALRALGVDGSLNSTGGTASDIDFGTLVEIQRTAAAIGGAVLWEVAADVTTTALAALRDAGVDAVVVPLSDANLVASCAKAIRELPPRKPRRGREWTALSPQSDD